MQSHGVALAIFQWTCLPPGPTSIWLDNEARIVRPSGLLMQVEAEVIGIKGDSASDSLNSNGHGGCASKPYPRARSR